MNTIAIRSFTKSEFEAIKKDLKAELNGFSYRQNKHNGIGINPTKKIDFEITLEQADFILEVLKKHNCFTKFAEEHVEVFRTNNHKHVHSQTFSMIHKLA